MDGSISASAAGLSTRRKSQRAARAPVAPPAGNGSNISVRTRLFGIAGLGLSFALVIGATGLWCADSAAEGVNLVRESSAALSSQLQADMMHDAMRGDVLASLVAVTPEEIATARADAAEHVERFRGEMNSIDATNPSPALKAKVDAVRPAIESYAKATLDMIELAGKDRAAAMTALPGFYEQFGVVEDRMEALSGEIEAEQERQNNEVEAGLAATHNVILGVSGLSVLILGLVSGLVTRSITRPLHEAVEGLEALSRWDCTWRMQVQSHDELGQMGVALNHSLENLGTAVGTISENTGGMSKSSADLTRVSEELTQAAQTTAQQVVRVSNAAGEVSRNVNTVAAAVEEMNASIKEIGQSVDEAARVATEAVTVAERTNATVSKLGDSSAEIGKVVGVINSIAEQTNLLALNATIEAARAGEAGKGFAVVANEVKDLAKETAAATEEISRKIAMIQNDTHVAVDAIQQITTIIQRIHQMQSNVAGAVQQQQATTAEIARSVSFVAEGSAEIARSIEGVSASAEGTTSGAARTRQAAVQLSEVVGTLQQVVSQFRY